ncbi:DUF805 domain-containing protein [Cellulophaga baltica]|uniref:DUF805 domain-containing protein n=1 Tax=Cellulophaga TaxID=104264 RepID=UPI001C069C60|nr:MULTISPECIES: DUF805 domain-containing protein [Cellulophaga]MBU2995117.1 DUF805 domain-containing protein [Cellulophaga baltica]MDO6766512.1 DUF805 domain-containing protein [Cellulophaga sp. 1_MG-2023]
MEWFLLAFKKYADFSGRSRRKEYWMFVLFNIIVVLGVVFIGAAIGLEEYIAYPLGLYILTIIIPSLALAVRRLHDQGKSGWYILVRFVPVIGGVWFLVLMCVEGDSITNEYGLNPKDPINNELDDIGVSQA